MCMFNEHKNLYFDGEQGVDMISKYYEVNDYMCDLDLFYHLAGSECVIS